MSILHAAISVCMGAGLFVLVWYWRSIGITWNTVVFIKPAAEINQFATFATKGAPVLCRGPGHCISAGWAADSLWWLLVSCHGRVMRLDDAAGQLEFHVLVSLPGTLFIGRELQKACRETMTSTTQFCKVGQPGW